MMATQSYIASAISNKWKQSIANPYLFCTLTFTTIFLIIYTSHWLKSDRRRVPVGSSELDDDEARMGNYLVLPNEPPPIDKLPNLSSITWPPLQLASQPSGRRYLTNGSFAPIPPPFDPFVSKNQRVLLFNLLEAFSKVMLSLSLNDRWYLCSGSLLGSIRHQDMIPWDDDIDVCVDYEVRAQMEHALANELRPGYRLSTTADSAKLHTAPIELRQEELDLPMSRPSTGFKWPWPFLDILFYEKHHNVLYEKFDRRYSIPYDSVFPLYYRPFGTNWYPTPRDPLRYLTDLYAHPIKLCSSIGWCHVHEKGLDSKSLDCDILAKRYAFVQCTDNNTDPGIVNQTVVPSSSPSSSNFGMKLVNESLMMPRSVDVDNTNTTETHHYEIHRIEVVSVA